MAYKEDYPVIKSWPRSTNYPIGTRRCFHYTLTFEQVEKLSKDAEKIGRGSAVETAAGIGIPIAVAVAVKKALGTDTIKLCGKSIMGVGTTVSLFMAWCNHKHQPYIDECIAIGRIWTEIYDCMKYGGYKRVTISQEIVLDAIYGIDLFLEGFPVWRYAKRPRVPDISYYYKK